MGWYCSQQAACHGYPRIMTSVLGAWCFDDVLHVHEQGHCPGPLYVVLMPSATAFAAANVPWWFIRGLGST